MEVIRRNETTNTQHHDKALRDRLGPQTSDRITDSRQYCKTSRSSITHKRPAISYILKTRHCTIYAFITSLLLLAILLALPQSTHCLDSDKPSPSGDQNGGDHVRSFQDETSSSDGHETPASNSEQIESVNRPSSSAAASPPATPMPASPYPTSYDLPDPNRETRPPLMAGVDDDRPSIDPETGDPIYQAPYDLSVVRLNDTSIVLRWEIEETGNGILQFFKIQYKSTKKNEIWRTVDREITANIRAHQINGLRPGSYLLGVTAVYDNDDNVQSRQIKYRLRASSKLLPNELPEMKAPEILYRRAEYDNIVFKWRYNPKKEDFEDVGYLVYYRSLHIVMDFLIYTSLDESIELSEVEPDTPYEAKVVAYNRVTVSNFSETVVIKTPPHPNATINLANATTAPGPSTAAPPTLLYTTPSPADKNSNLLIDQNQYTTQEPPSDDRSSSDHRYNSNTTLKPIVITPPPAFKNKPTTTQFFTSNQTLSSFFEFVMGDPSDTMTAIRYALLAVLLIIIIASVALCLTSCYQNRNHSPPSSTTESAQFDLEINSYFKNSFPGEYTWQNDVRVM